MAQKAPTRFIDDIDGGEAAGTVRFALDGIEYEIDLSAKHRDELRDALKGYIGHARRVSGSSRRSARGVRKPSAIDPAVVRAWARERGIGVKERGRVPASVTAQYRQATGK
jgi:hypothetical protein